MKGERERGRDWQGRKGWRTIHLCIIILSIHSFIRAKGQGEVRVHNLAFLKSFKYMHLMYFYFQLEQRCFTQQEQLESLQEQQEEDHLKYQKRISDLEARVEQVRGGRGGGGCRGTCDDVRPW